MKVHEFVNTIDSCNMRNYVRHQFNQEGMKMLLSKYNNFWNIIVNEQKQNMILSSCVN